MHVATRMYRQTGWHSSFHNFIVNFDHMVFMFYRMYKLELTDVSLAHEASKHVQLERKSYKNDL